LEQKEELSVAILLCVVGILLKQGDLLLDRGDLLTNFLQLGHPV
jgi:hypothetical protein